MYYNTIETSALESHENVNVQKSSCNKASCKTCALACISIIFIIFVCCIFGIVLLIASGLTVPNKISHIEKRIGQDLFTSPSLISTNSSIFKLNITIISNDEGSVNIYESNTIPPTYKSILPFKELKTIFQPSRVSFNYNGANDPIYLQTGFVLSYIVSTTTETNSTNCIGRLHLFDDYSHYISFLSGDSSTSLNSSSCFDFSSSLNFTWSFSITNPSAYYVAIAVNFNVTVFGFVSVSADLYNTTNLSSPRSCPTTLNSTNLFCLVSTCSSFYCNAGEIFYVIKPSSSIVVSYVFIHTNIDGQENFTLFVVSVIIFFFSVVLLCFLCSCILLLCLN